MQTQEQLSPNARDNAVLLHLRPALDEALASGRPTSVSWVPSSHESHELVALALDLCKRAGGNVAVLANREARGLTFAPLR